jgi:ABC-type nitrate/sulfonate/bicarbonate transport system substrate-binding protein
MAVLIAFPKLEAWPEGRSSVDKVVIAQFGKEKFLLYLPLYVAMEEGLFLKRGLEVKVHTNS